MTLRDSVANWLDPVFVREEELALALERKATSQTGQLVRRNINAGIITGSNLIDLIVPSSYEWFIYSVIATEPTDVGAGSLPKENYLEIQDDLGNIIFALPMQQLPAQTATSYLQWGIDLTNMREDDGSVPPSYKITSPLPKMWLHEGYHIVMNRDGVGGAPTTNSSWRVLVNEYRKVS